MERGTMERGTDYCVHRTSIQTIDALPEAGVSKATVKPSAFFSQMARLQSQDCSTKTA